MRILPVMLVLTMVTGVSAQTLTAQDYAEIRGVTQYYNLGYDSSARVDGGAVVARAFMPEMAFTREGGTQAWYSAKEMGEYAAKATPGTNHWDSNVIIEPHPEGARLFSYTLVYRVSDVGSPVTIGTAGTLDHVLVRTPEGWFIKKRHNHDRSSTKPLEFPRFAGRPVAPAQSAGGAARGGKSPLSALDYIEIEMLYGWNNIALDSAAEKGEMFARTFTADGSLQIDGRTVTGRKGLTEYAAGGVPALRSWLGNLYIEPSPDGAIGWAYVVTIDGLDQKGPTGRAAIQRGGLFRDVLVKTPDGWRFKSRTFTPGNSVSTSLPLPKVR